MVEEKFKRRSRKKFFPVKKCYFCAQKISVIDYKDVETLRHYTTERGKILARRITGACSKHQRVLVHAIKRARYIALIPFGGE